MYPYVAISLKVFGNFLMRDLIEFAYITLHAYMEAL